LNRFSSSSTSRLGPGASAFTLLEIVVVILVISILSVLIFESYRNVEAKAQRMRCTSNLKGLYGALDAYTHDQQHWPQNPFELGHPQFDVWWQKELSRYNLGRANWECPTYKRLKESGKAEKVDEKAIDYVPTPFDDQPRTPYKWASQPWAVEVGDFHGDGNLILFPDGAVKGFNQFSAGGR
jgi:prepilin-type N-terminal cleavage/methylation domain-containing protein